MRARRLASLHVVSHGRVKALFAGGPDAGVNGGEVFDGGEEVVEGGDGEDAGLGLGREGFLRCCEAMVLLRGGARGEERGGFSEEGQEPVDFDGGAAGWVVEPAVDAVSGAVDYRYEVFGCSSSSSERAHLSRFVRVCVAEVVELPQSGVAGDVIL